MNKEAFTCIWEYHVKNDQIDNFVNTYGPDGEWVELFKKSDGYLSTMLNEDSSDPNRFITVDSWRSERDHHQFLSAYAEEYKALDKLCEKFTEEENLIGHFKQLAD